MISNGKEHDTVIEVNLEQLYGEHILDAVDLSNEQVKTWGDRFESAQVMRFRLDGKVYTAVEDPNDGYRSSMNKLFVSEDVIKNVFTPCRVVGKKKSDDKWGKNDTLELIDCATGQTVLEVGTDNADDYYPRFVASFKPENMASNRP